jgi:two-component system response regulator NreC
MDKIRVLLADDHPIVRLGLRALLAGEPDMEVVGEAATGLQAVALARQLCPDLVLMDITMPGDGLDATRQIRATCPDTLVLILTVHAEASYLFRLLKAGASGYVLKSTADEELIKAIRTVVEGGAFLYPSATKMLIEDYVARHQEDGGQNIYEQLSDREREVFGLVARGYTAREIAVKLHLSDKSVETYRQRIMHKMNLPSRAALVEYALANGLLDDDLSGPKAESPSPKLLTKL